MKQIIMGKLYDTKTAELVADDEFTSGRNRLNTGRATHLYKTKKGNFFAHNETIWHGEHDSIRPLSVEEAKQMYESLQDHTMSWEQAFGEKPGEA